MLLYIFWVRSIAIKFEFRAKYLCLHNNVRYIDTYVHSKESLDKKICNQRASNLSSDPGAEVKDG